MSWGSHIVEQYLQYRSHESFVGYFFNMAIAYREISSYES